MVKKKLRLTSEVSLGTKKSRPHVFLREIVEGRSMVVESYLTLCESGKNVFWLVLYKPSSTEQESYR